MSNKEILTLQFGHYSNFVGAHWWNTQEQGFSYNPDSPSDINHDVLFREGLNYKNEVTFTPRLLLVDLKGSLRTLPQESELYQVPCDVPQTEYEVIAEKPEEKNKFQQGLDKGALSEVSESEVRVWSDFLYSRFHPRSVNVIREYQHDEKNFDIFPLGRNLWRSEQFSEDFVDKIRSYVEECDHFQGFHVLLDANDGFGGLSVSCLEHLRDEYESKPIFALPNLTKTDLSLILCYAGLIEHSSLFSPLSPKENGHPYRTSAILASTLETATLPYRLKTPTLTLTDLCSDFSVNGRKAIATSFNLPFFQTNDYLIDYLDNFSGNLTQSLTPNCDISFDNSLQLVSVRGIDQSRLKHVKHREMPAFRCQTVKEMLEFFLQCTCFGSKSAVCVCNEALPIKAPFPRLWEGESVGALAGLHSGRYLGAAFDQVGGARKWEKFHQFLSEGVEKDEVSESVETVLTLKDCYEDSFL